MGRNKLHVVRGERGSMSSLQLYVFGGWEGCWVIRIYTIGRQS